MDVRSLFCEVIIEYTLDLWDLASMFTSEEPNLTWFFVWPSEIIVYCRHLNLTVNHEHSEFVVVLIDVLFLRLTHMADNCKGHYQKEVCSHHKHV